MKLYNPTDEKQTILFKAFWGHYIAELSQYSRELQTKTEDLETAMKSIKNNPFFKRYFLTDHNDTPIGFLLLGFDQNTHPQTDWYIGEFFIRPEERRKGYGRKAVEEMLTEYPGRYCYFVLKKNKPAKTFWEYIRKEFSCVDIKKQLAGRKNIDECTFEAFEYHNKEEGINQ